MKFSDAYSPGRAITAGWEALKRSPLPILVGAFLLALTSEEWGVKGRVESGWERFSDFGDGSSFLPFLLPLLIFGSLFAVLKFLLQVFVLSGYLQTGARVTRGEGAEFESIFMGAGRFLDLLLWEVVRHIVLAIALMVLAIPFIPLVIFGAFAHANIVLILGVIFFGLFIVMPVMLYVDCGLFFGSYRVVIDGRGPIDALKESWRLADGNRLWLILFRLVMGVFSLLGFFAFFVGVIVTKAIADMGTIGAYLDFTRGPFTAPSTTPSLPLPPVPPGAPNEPETRSEP